jgi:peptidoglycan/LPS O-acetylase OafA/YrhL
MNRSLLIDATKVLASQLIVLHHLSIYSPMTDVLAAAWPRLLAFIADEGRLAVQPFLVIGGYLSALSLSKRADAAPVPLIWQRYLRLAPQLLVALVLVVFSTLLVGDVLAHEAWLSPLPTLGQLLAQVFLLQDVLSIPSISAGAWYVAIDLQLFALFALLAYWSGRSGRPLARSPAPALVAFASIASLHVFSRHPALDAWAIYFMSAYGLGALVAWARLDPFARPWLLLTVFALLADAAWDARVRPLLALVTAVALFGLAHRSWPACPPLLRTVVNGLSDVSYSVFVCHFAVIVLLSGLWQRAGFDGTAWALAFTLAAWLSALLVGAGVQALVDRAQPSGTPRKRCYNLASRTNTGA